jgi:hypothetical protein
VARPRAKPRKIKIGGALPAVPCSITDAPVGACVQIAPACVGPMEPACRLCAPSGHWFVVTGAISGDVIMRALDAPPTDPAWAASRSRLYLVPPATRVLSIAWPIRFDAHADGVVDPVSRKVPDDGDLFRRFAWERD